MFPYAGRDGCFYKKDTDMAGPGKISCSAERSEPLSFDISALKPDSDTAAPAIL